MKEHTMRRWMVSGGIWQCQGLAVVLGCVGYVLVLEGWEKGAWLTIVGLVMSLTSVYYWCRCKDG